MSVLQFGVPHREGLRCDNPVCNEFAQHRIELAGYEPGMTLKECWACDAHLAQLQVGKAVTHVTKLKVAGERSEPVKKP